MLPSRIKFFLLGNIIVEAIGYSIVQVLRPWNIALATVILLLLYGTFLIGSILYSCNIDRKIMFIYIGSRHHFTYFQPCVYRIELARVWKMKEKRYYMPKVNRQIAPKRGNGYIIGRFSIVTKERKKKKKNGRKNLMWVCIDHHLPFGLGLSTPIEKFPYYGSFSTRSVCVADVCAFKEKKKKKKSSSQT